jgi:hypothetical protein
MGALPEGGIDFPAASLPALVERVSRVDLAFEWRTPVRIVRIYLVDGPLDPILDQYLSFCPELTERTKVVNLLLPIASCMTGKFLTFVQERSVHTSSEVGCSVGWRTATRSFCSQDN